jgi:excinuclease UvrABC nuclease subunit
MTRPPDLKEIDEEVDRLNKEKEDAVANQDFEKAAALRDQADKLRKKKDDHPRMARESRETDGVVDEEVIAEVVSKMTGIPLTRLSTEDSLRLMRMEDELHKRVVSQDAGDQSRLQSRASQSQRIEGSQAAHRLLHLRRAPPASAKRCWPRPWRNSCSAIRTRSCTST